jgi:hypothetical protein
MQKETKQLDLFEGISNKDFIEYHKTNPHLYEAFKNIALRAINLGFQNYGAKGIFEIIRWERAERGDGEFKINNNYAPLFTRLFDNEYPQHQNFFRKRRSSFDNYCEQSDKN